MTTKFVYEIETTIGRTLSDRRLKFIDAFDGTDSGGRDLKVAYFGNSECKIQIYYWAREVETNCMIGLLDAPNEFGLLSNSTKWQFLTRFGEARDLPLAEIAEHARLELSSFANPLEWVGDCTARFYDVALAGMKERYRS
ncbi:hypothetical protein [Mycolicibacterium bacteremicum]|uniref:Uncharacterized protein n=1 Tax=Mycolicibacterium bacteremicum TaxID=564198 RepID=A0A1W9YNP2_MYCBA|nr:hypothetical protein [Mycolicibacterium bacteremicum]MCV7430165.1 hypothetical protein [Mycolicibacterium bacteremicum]ORA01532.1 hypothetical protein BST17_27905 [Mycolicibacterium bacteremicum]